MKKIGIREFGFGVSSHVREALREPLAITNNGRQVAVLLGAEEFQRLMQAQANEGLREKGVQMHTA